MPLVVAKDGHCDAYVDEADQASGERQRIEDQLKAPVFEGLHVPRLRGAFTKEIREAATDFGEKVREAFLGSQDGDSSSPLIEKQASSTEKFARIATLFQHDLTTEADIQRATELLDELPIQRGSMEWGTTIVTTDCKTGETTVMTLTGSYLVRTPHGIYSCI